MCVFGVVGFKIQVQVKICIIELYLLKYYFESIYTCRYYTQTNFNQLNIMVSYVDIIGLWHSVAILWEIYVMWPTCHVRWLGFHFKRMLIIGLGQYTLVQVQVQGLYRLKMSSDFSNVQCWGAGISKKGLARGS